MPECIRAVFRVLSLAVGIVLFLAAVLAGFTVYFNAPPGISPRSTDTVTVEESYALVEVRQGESAASVGQRLETAGLIKNRYFWNLLYRLNKQFVKTGMYQFDIPASQLKIRSLLVSGRQTLVRVTIPEGVTLKKTALILEDAGICAAADFLAAASDQAVLDFYHVPGKTMEGYLYPDTYFFSLAYPAVQVVNTMADTFFQRIAELTGGTKNLNARELNERVIVASVVEREYREAGEAPRMAGVFYNRLRIGMPLQSCATVEYVITEIQGRPHPEVLYNRDIEIRDPYNTYIRAGLPPGPISAPGRTALNAAFNPAPSDYLYFRLVDPFRGQHYFSRTLDDHIQAGVLYVKGRAGS
ncbi:MAG: endolytic transglycosylase MltG [Treponema sp.]|jgi:UPF0755 protein|nr:endolytic transglycosylase MltG [Treponema sp.]